MFNQSIRVFGVQKIAVEIAPRELAYALMQIVLQKIGDVDDGGCDWCTNRAGETYIGFNPTWKVSADPAIAVLVDAANVLLNGRRLDLSENA